MVFPFELNGIQCVILQIVAALAVSLGPLAAGLGKGYSSPAIASLQELQIRPRGNYTSFTITDQQASWVASLSLLGELKVKKKPSSIHSIKTYKKISTSFDVIYQMLKKIETVFQQ